MKTFTFRSLLLSAFALFGTTTVFAQVKGISYTLSPAANYTFWDSELGLSDGFLYGGRLGIGFGENVELRGTYLRDLSMERDVDGFFNNDFTGLSDRDVGLVRYGGEVRLSLGRSKLLPFLTLGGGIQSIELDGGLKNEHIYASGGLGLTVSIADRFTFRVEGKNTAFNFNPGRNLLTADERDVFGVGSDNLSFERLSNWSIGTGFTIYLGGRRQGEMTDLDRAYAEIFNNGFRGLSLIVEPTLSHINFADELAYRDTYLGGVSLGLDFGPYVGVRAFYLRNMDDNEINLDFDRMQLYGADFRFRLTSITTGLSPFLTLGGGYIDLDDDYIGREESIAGLESQVFASGGAGASINIARNFRILGSYKLLLTTGTDVENLSTTDEIRSSGQWTAGIDLAFGNKAKRPEAMFTSAAEEQVRQARLEADLARQEALAEQAKKNAEDTRELRESYEARVSDLQTELQAAYAVRDTIGIDSLQIAIEDTEAVVAELETREEELAQTIRDSENQTVALRNESAAQGSDGRPTTAFSSSNPAPASAPRNFRNVNSNRNANPYGESGLSLTPAEFEGLLEEIFEGLNAGMPPVPSMAPDQYDAVAPAYYDTPAAPRDTARVSALERQLDNLKASVDDLRRQQEEIKTAREADKQAMRKEMQENTRSILEEIRSMREQLNEESDRTKKDAEKKN